MLRAKSLDESPIEQMRRLFADFLATAAGLKDVDPQGRIRLDDREMLPEVQAEVMALWPQVTTENLRTLTDFAGFQREFRNLFGFELDGVDYELPVETNLEL